jgi:hypothetical protein
MAILNISVHISNGSDLTGDLRGRRGRRRREPE